MSCSFGEERKERLENNEKADKKLGEVKSSSSGIEDEKRLFVQRETDRGRSVLPIQRDGRVGTVSLVV